MSMIQGIILEIWNVLNEASFYILIGLLISGIIQSFIDHDQIKKYLGTKSFKSVFLSSLFGVPLPLCSCGVIPTAISLRKSGASKGATLSFLISTPETGIDSFLLSFALLDPIMAVFRPIVAFMAALIAGLMDNFFEKDNSQDIAENKSCCHNKSNVRNTKTLRQRMIEGMRYAFVDLLQDIGKWFILGVVLAGLISYFVPASFIENNLNEGLGAMFIMLLAGIPIYICASASTPIAAALILKGMSPGVALVFLLTGPATNAATITIVARFLGMRSVLIYIFVIASTAVCAGLALNGFYSFMGINPQVSMGHMTHIINSDLKNYSAFLFIILLIFVYIKKLFKKDCCH